MEPGLKWRQCTPHTPTDMCIHVIEADGSGRNRSGSCLGDKPPGSVKTQAIHDSGIASSSLKNSPTLPDPLFFWYLAVVPSEGPLVTDGMVLPEIYR